MLTPAEELLAAVKEHATAEDYFEFIGDDGRSAILKLFGWDNVEVDNQFGAWIETVMEVHPCVQVTHPTASSAVQSAFARARGKQP